MDRNADQRTAHSGAHPDDAPAGDRDGALGRPVDGFDDGGTGATADGSAPVLQADGGRSHSRARRRDRDDDSDHDDTSRRTKDGDRDSDRSERGDDFYQSHDRPYGFGATDDAESAGFLPDHGSSHGRGQPTVRAADTPGAGTEKLTGGTGGDTLYGGDGNDKLNGGAGSDTLHGGAGNDRLHGGAGNDTIHGDDGRDSLKGGGGDDALFGGAGKDDLKGGGGDDILDGGAGDDRLHGGGGSDRFVFSADFGDDTISGFVAGLDRIDVSAFDVGSFSDLLDRITDVDGDAVITLDDGTITLRDVGKDDLLESDFVGLDAYVGPTDGDDLILGTEGDDILDGLAGNDTISGLAGNDLLIGGAGDDAMAGGAGDDTYVVDSAGDSVTENAGEGVDTVHSAISYALGANVENLTLTGPAAIDGAGNDLDNVIIGNAVANVLDGGGGADSLAGGAGDDTYLVDDSGDSITEGAGDGIDSVFSSVSHTLDANVENLTLTGLDAIDGAGNDLDNLIVGNEAANTLDGGAGDDAMAGGAGDDTYVVDSAGDSVTENAGEGVDTVHSSISYALGADVENLTLTGPDAIDGAGNDLDNVIIGNSAANTLDGGVGADAMAGGAGDDTYVVDSAGDSVTENAGEGVDTVHSAISYTLGANVENLTLTGLDATTGSGNALDNTMTGNAAANTLYGNDGDDVISGGDGNDTIYGGNGADELFGGAGRDRLFGDAGGDMLDGGDGDDALIGGDDNDILIGGAGDDWMLSGDGTDQLYGGAGRDRLFGGIDNDIVNGGAGADSLTGGGGSDTFVYAALADGGDTIVDFSTGAGGDALDISALLGDIGFAGADPFADGYVRTLQSGTDTLVQIDANGGGGDFVTLTTLRNVTQTTFDEDNWVLI